MGCIAQIKGKKDSGKTAVIEKVIGMLRTNFPGITIAVFKHSHHSLDLQGKDTDRFRRAGADVIVFQEGEEESVIFLPGFQGFKLIDLIPVDVVLIEGFSKIDVSRSFEIDNVSQIEETSRKVFENLVECLKVEKRNDERKEDPLVLFALSILKKYGLR
ncbi:MAG: molybdopterin-guanine dinucleotide biosynthesis protein B [Sulfolobaceae archaeon]|nr:molybdopterin-guanine dinucleotide biosynthesis protein B [Sulfolobaceae archaeon]